MRRTIAAVLALILVMQASCARGDVTLLGIQVKDTPAPATEAEKTPAPQAVQATYPPVTQEEVEALADGAIGRPHIARVMIAHGVVPDVRTAFRDYIGLNAPAYAERRKMTSEQVIRNIRAAGGVPVLAHGGLLRIGEVQMNQWIDAMVRAGLMGLECYHNAHTPAMERFLRNAAAKRGLLVTGGSDFHGVTRKDIDLGTGLSRWDDRQGCRGKLLSAIEQVSIQP